MARGGAQRQADKAKVYNLDRFMPAPIPFETGGRTYRVSGDPDVEVVALMMRLERQIRGLDENVDDEDQVGDEIAEAIVEARDLLITLAQEYDPEIKTMRIGVGGILTVFALITGGNTVADAVADALTAGMEEARATDEEIEELASAEGAEGGEGSSPPLPHSKRRSSARSSRSAA